MTIRIKVNEREVEFDIGCQYGPMSRLLTIVIGRDHVSQPARHVQPPQKVGGF